MIVIGIQTLVPCSSGNVTINANIGPTFSEHWNNIGSMLTQQFCGNQHWPNGFLAQYFLVTWNLIFVKYNLKIIYCSS